MKMFPFQEWPFSLICLDHPETCPNSTLSWCSAHVLQASVICLETMPEDWTLDKTC